MVCCVSSRIARRQYSRFAYSAISGSKRQTMYGCTSRLNSPFYQERLFKLLSSKNEKPMDNWHSAIESALLAYQTSGSAQRSSCEPRQAGNGATVATTACVAGKSEVWLVWKRSPSPRLLNLS